MYKLKGENNIIKRSICVLLTTAIIFTTISVPSSIFTASAQITSNYIYGNYSLSSTSNFYGYNSLINRPTTGGEDCYDYSVCLLKTGEDTGQRYRVFSGTRWKSSFGDGDHIIQTTSPNGQPNTWTMWDDEPEFWQGQETGQVNTWYAGNCLEPVVLHTPESGWIMYTNVEIQAGQPTDSPGVTATGFAGRIALFTSPDCRTWTRKTDRGVITNVTAPESTAFTHQAVMYVPWDTDGKKFWMYVNVIQNGTPMGYCRIRSSSCDTFDYNNREATIGVGELGGKVGYLKEAPGGPIFVRTLTTISGSKTVPCLQFSKDGLDWTMDSYLNLEGSENNVNNKNCYFVGFSTINGTGQVEYAGNNQWTGLYAAATSNTSVSPEIFKSEIGYGTFTINLNQIKDITEVNMPSGMIDVGHSQTVYFSLDKKVMDGVPDTGNLITAIQKDYLDYFSINGNMARSIENKNPGSIVMHYDVVSNVFTVYIKKGVQGALNPTQLNTVILSKDFPLLGTKKLETGYKFIYLPATTEWAKWEYVSAKVSMPPVMAPVTLPDRETVYISFDRKVRELEVGESLTYGYLITLTQERYLDYIFINGVNARTIQKANSGAIVMHYDINSNTFTLYIMKNIVGGFDRTKSNEIILTKYFPLLGTEKLGITYKFSNPPMTDSTTSTIWTKSEYTQNLPLDVTMTPIMAPVTSPIRETVYIDFDRKVRQLEAGESLVAGYLIILTQDRYLDYIYINGMNGRTMENANPGAIQIHYDVISDIFTIYIMRNIVGGLERTKSNEIILTKDFPLLGTEKLETTYKFTNQPMANALATSTTWTKALLPSLTVRNYKLSSDGSKIISNISQGLTVANFIKGGVIAGDNKTSFEFIAADETTKLGQKNTIGTGTTVNVCVDNSIVDSYIIKLYGDVTGNGVIDLEDLLSIRDHLLEATFIQDKFKPAGDLFGEGDITLNDLVGLMAFVSESGNINQAM